MLTKISSILWFPLRVLWGTILFALLINIVSTWLTTKGFDPTGTPLGWILAHLFVPGGILLFLALLTIVTWVAQRRGTVDPWVQQEQDVLQAVGKALQTNPGPQFPTIAALLPLLQNRYFPQDIIDALEWLDKDEALKLHQSFGDPKDWSFELTPRGKRTLAGHNPTKERKQ